MNRVTLALNIGIRVAIAYWLAEAWILRDDPRFLGKAIAERNTVVVGTLSLLLPVTWALRRRPWTTYPFALDVLYLSIFAFDMAGNSFNIYNRFAHFDLLPHFHGPGAVAGLVAAAWTHLRRPAHEDRRSACWLAETVAVGAFFASYVHVLLEAQEYYTDVFAGTVNVRGVADTVNDLLVGLAGGLSYPLVWALIARRGPQAGSTADTRARS